MVDKRDADHRAAPGADNGSPGDRTESLETRRRRLEAELAARRKGEAEAGEPKERAQGYALAVKLSSEFIAGIVVGAFLGYLLDRFAGTSPWGMIVLLLIGFCAGTLNVLRSTGAVAEPRAGRRQAGDGTRDKTD